MEEELGVSSGGRLHIPDGGDSSFVERENSGLEFQQLSLYYYIIINIQKCEISSTAPQQFSTKPSIMNK